MKKEITYKSKDEQTTINAVIWSPETEPIGIIQILHGMNEHINRYENTAAFYVQQGYVVCGHDCLGHGKSVIDKDHYGYFAKKDSKNILIEDAYEMTKLVKAEYPNLPVTLLGYSFGSTIARNYIQTHSEDINNVVLIGSPNHSKLKMIYAIIHAKVISFYKRGEFYRSKNLENLTTGSFKKYYKTKNKIAWMSKDEDFLNSLTADPYCKYRFTVNGYVGMFKMILSANSKLKDVTNKNLPIFLMTGKDDPVTKFGAATIKLDSIYKKKGFTNVRYKIYNGLRHYLLNEVERSIILNDIFFFMKNTNK